MDRDDDHPVTPPVQSYTPPHAERRGLRHVVAATGYSMAGGRVLLREPAGRLHCVMAGLVLALFLLVGATLNQTFVLLGLFAVCLCVEALNTAIEAIVDRASPERSDFARDAKDLGSFAVFCALVIFNGYALIIVGSRLA